MYYCFSNSNLVEDGTYSTVVITEAKGLYLGVFFQSILLIFSKTPASHGR